MVRFQIFHFDPIRFDVQPKNRNSIRSMYPLQSWAGITQHACHGECRQPPYRHCIASNYVAHLTRLDRRTYMKPNYAARLIRSKHMPSLRCQNTVASNYVVIYIIIIGLQLSNFVSAGNGDYPAKSCLVISK